MGAGQSKLDVADHKRPSPPGSSWWTDGHSLGSPDFVGGTSRGRSAALPHGGCQSPSVGIPSQTGIPGSCATVTPATSRGSLTNLWCARDSPTYPPAGLLTPEAKCHLARGQHRSARAPTTHSGLASDQWPMVPRWAPVWKLALLQA